MAASPVDPAALTGNWQRPTLAWDDVRWDPHRASPLPIGTRRRWCSPVTRAGLVLANTTLVREEAIEVVAAMKEARAC